MIRHTLLRFIPFTCLMLLGLNSLIAQIQNPTQTILFMSSDVKGEVLEPGGAALQIPVTVSNQIHAKYTLRVVGGGVMPGRFAPRGEEFFRQQEGLIDDNLDSINVYNDIYSLYFQGNNDYYERMAYFRIDADKIRNGFSLAYRRNHLKVDAKGYFGVTLQLYFAKEGREKADIYDEADSTLFIPIPEGSGEYQVMQHKLQLPKKVVTVLVCLGGVHFDGACWMEAPSCCSPFVPDEQRLDDTNYWVGINLATRFWPKWKVEWESVANPSSKRTLFEGTIFDRASNIADFYVELPADVGGKGTLWLSLMTDKPRKSFPYAVRSVQLLEEKARDFELAVVPTFVRVGDTTALLLVTHTPNSGSVTTTSSAIELLDTTWLAQTPGLYALSFVAKEPDQDVKLVVSDGHREETATITQLVIKEQDNVLLSSGDEIYIDKGNTLYQSFFAWYFRNRVGNAYHFRPSYQWSGVRLATMDAMKPYLDLLNKMHIPYAWQVEGRTLAASRINLTNEQLESPLFRGKQAHENDGGYYYWQHFTYKGLHSDLAARTRPFGGIFAKHRPIYTPYGTFIHYDPYAVQDMADGAQRFVANLSYSRGESKRHTGPSTLFRYLYQAGYEWLGAEQMYGPEDIVLSSLRGASRAYGKSEYGSLHAMQWGSGPFTDPKHALRLYLSLAVAYIHGSSHMNTEEALWTDEYANDRYTESGQAHLYAQNQMLDYIQTHTRKGHLLTKIAVIQGRNDAWKCFGRTNAWSQIGDKWAFNQAMESFDLLQVFYPENRLNYCGKEGLFTHTPYGPIDLLPIEASEKVLQSYKVLVFLGWNTFQHQDFDRLLSYVQQGGTLLLAAAHLNNTLQPHLPCTLPTKDATLSKLLGPNYASYDQRVERTLGKGRVIYYPYTSYPADSSYREAYQKDMMTLAMQCNEQEKAQGWVLDSPFIDFSVWDTPTNRTLYLLNVDWQSETASQPARFTMGSSIFTVDVPRYTLLTLRCKEGVAAYMTENTSDVLTIQREEERLHITCQTTGSDTLRVCIGNTGAQKTIPITGAGIHTITL